MYLLAECTALIQCPLPIAYQYAANMERFGEWFPGVIAIRSVDALPIATVGKAYLERARIPLRGEREISLQVRESRPNAFFATEGRFPPLLPRMEMAFQATGDASCEVTWRMFSRNQSWLAALTFLPLAKGAVRKRAELGMKNLKQRLEAMARQA